MNAEQWELLRSIVEGKKTDKAVPGLIIDSPWIPGWYGISTMQYYGSGDLWFRANMEAIKTFPQVIFLPGFWSEFGMCTEPSAFGAKMTWNEHSLPHAGKVISDISEVLSMQKPDPRTEGLLPFILQRLSEYHDRIRQEGHEIRFAIARGPMNIASFLMGTSEFMMALIMNPEECHRLLRLITDFTIDWLQLQKECFPSIDGILVLDDIVGFVDDQNCRDFAVPYLKEIFDSFESRVRFFHNDANGLVSTPYLKDMNINLFNFSFDHSIAQIRELAGKDITLLGNLPPRDVLAEGSVEEVREGVREMYASIETKERIIWSVGGGMPQGVSTENLDMFLETLEEVSGS